MSELRMRFPGGRKVEVQIGSHVVLTDQPSENGGDDEAPSPYSLFLASIGGCAGFYALAFCQARQISTEGLEVVAIPRKEENVLAGVDIRVTLPEGFPERYRGAILKAIEQCSVKRAIEARPRFDVQLAESIAPGLSST